MQRNTCQLYCFVLFWIKQKKTDSRWMKNIILPIKSNSSISWSHHTWSVVQLYAMYFRTINLFFSKVLTEWKGSRTQKRSCNNFHTLNNFILFTKRLNFEVESWWSVCHIVFRGHLLKHFQKSSMNVCSILNYFNFF